MLPLLETNLGDLTQQAASKAASAALPFVGNHLLLIAGVILVILAVGIILQLKDLLINSILGLVVWAIAFFVIGIKVSLVPSLVVSAIFGLAGIGTILILYFMGIVI